MQYYSYMIIFDDGITEIVKADNIIDAIEQCNADWYGKSVLSVVRMGFAR